MPTVPLRIRIARGDVCDLPDPFALESWWHGSEHCQWTWLGDGHGLCTCELCHGGHASRRERRTERQSVHRDLHDLAIRWRHGDRE